MYNKLREAGIDRDAAIKLRDWTTPKIDTIIQGKSNPIALMGYQFDPDKKKWIEKDPGSQEVEK